MFEIDAFRLDNNNDCIKFVLPLNDRQRWREFVSYEKSNEYHVTIETQEERGTKKQNKLYHSLINIAYRSGCLSFTNECEEWFKNQIETEYGGEDAIELYKIVYEVNGQFKSVVLKTLDQELEQCKIIDVVKIAKSWTRINKKTRTKIINGLINAMITAGVNDNKFYEIIEELKCQN